MKHLISPSKRAGGVFLVVASRFFIRDVNTVQHWNGGNVCDGISRALALFSPSEVKEKSSLWPREILSRKAKATPSSVTHFLLDLLCIPEPLFLGRTKPGIAPCRGAWLSRINQLKPGNGRAAVERWDV